MSDDLVKRLRENCNCYLESSPCGAEDECRLAFEAASEITRLRAVNAKLVDALDDLLSWFPNEPSKPLWQLNAGEYGADGAVEAARAALLRAKGEA